MTIHGNNMGEQPIFTCKAHVFHIDPKTKRSWLAASSSAVNVSFFYDSSRALYRIISVEGTKAVINSTVTPNMTFTKTSQKFGQWSDVRANTVYGLGFSSEAELNKFIEKFSEVREATRTSTKPNSTTPTTSASASPVAARSSASVINKSAPDFGNVSVASGVVPSNAVTENNQQPPPSQDSPKKILESKGPAPNPPLSGEAQLKYENDRLKLALAQSSANAKKWEIELATLKNNNARLTSALQESTANVEEWKRQLHAYKEENTRLKVGLIELEAGRGNCDFNAMTELRNLRGRINELETDLRDRDEEVKTLKDQQAQHIKHTINGGQEDSDAIRNLHLENDALKKTLEKVQFQLDTSLDAQDQQRKVLEAINRQFGDHLSALGQLQDELTAVLNT